MKLRDALNNYYLSCRASKISPTTIAAYQYALENFYNYTGNIEVTELTATHVETFIIHEEDRRHNGKPLSPTSVNKFYAVLRTFCRWMYRRKVVHEQLTDLVKPPRMDKTLPEALSKERTKEVVRYLKDQEPFRNQVIMEFFLDTGMRLEEVSALNVDDLDFDGGYIHIRKGKGGKEAIIPLGDNLAAELHTYITRYRKPKKADEPALFINRSGKRLRRNGLSMLVRRISKRAGITGKYGAHKLRHTMATNFIRGGGNLEALRRILRHSSIKTTQIYTNLDVEDIKAEHHKSSLLDTLDMGY